MARIPNGVKLGQVSIASLVSQGSHGATYRAIGPRGEATVRMLEIGDDDELRARVRCELERLAEVQHRGVRQIYEFGDHGGALFVAMSLAPETTLEEIVDREGPLAEERVATIVEQTAEAVAALHEHGIVHADLSPRNLLIGEDDEVTLATLSTRNLIDLGVVREEQAESGYVAPELAGEGHRSPGADVFGIGAVTYAALTGRSPEVRGSVESVRPDLAGPWDQLIARAMSPNPSERPAAAEMAEQATFVAPQASAAVVPPDEDGEPPRSAYARVDAPRTTFAGNPFDVTLGLAPTPDFEVLGKEMVLPGSVRGSYKLTIHLVASGFTLVDGEDWTVELEVTAGLPYPTETLQLVAAEPEEKVRPLLLQALYSVGGQTIGEAVRPIAVCRADDGASEVTPPPIPPGFEVNLPEGFEPPDLEVTILKDANSPTGGLLWTFKSKHPQVKTPTADISSSIGTKPRDFVTNLVRQMPTYEGQIDLFDQMRGIGRSIADCMPTKTWELLAEVAEHADGRTPTVLLLSEEPYVPWEIATMEKPLDSDQAPFFAAQVTVGRWVLASADGRPPTPPRCSAAADSMAVVWGEYQAAGLERLAHAEEEAEDLHNTYGAQKVEAKTGPVHDCLHGKPASDILHFAVHGQYDPAGPEDGIILIDRRMLGPNVVRGVDLDPPRFVFLNACQVGNGSETLGIYSGMASAFLYAGASAVVAPLWSIDDGLARDLAKGFYEAAFAGTPPAEFLREKRASFTEKSSPKSSIEMAYQFFGHPDMLMARDDA
jgi:serine/threonine protein kinase